MTRSNLCEVCAKHPVIGVACVPGVPYSAGYCEECLKADAHPWWILVANTACCGSIKETAPWWQEMVMHTCAHLGKSMEEFEAEVARDSEQLEKL